MFDFLKNKADSAVSFQSHRVKRMLLEMGERGVKVVSVPSLEAVICEDGIVLLDLDKKGCKVCLVKHRTRLPDFYLNLSEEQMEAYNGGRGLNFRFMPYKK